MATSLGGADATASRLGRRIPAGSESLGTVYCYVGGLTNLAIAVGSHLLLQPRAPERPRVDGRHARRAAGPDARPRPRVAASHVGLERDLDGIEGEREIIEEAREVLQSGARRIADEVRLSIEYYHSTVPNAPRVDAPCMAGPGHRDRRPSHSARAGARAAGRVAQHGPGRGSAGRARQRGRRAPDGRHGPGARRGAGVRPVNLIPLEQRRGAARTAGKRPIRRLLPARRSRRRSAVRARAGADAQPGEREDRRGRRAKAKEAGAKSVADALRPYGQFAHSRRPASSRSSRSRSLASTGTTLRPVSLAIPVERLAAQCQRARSRPDVEVEAGGGDAPALRGDVPGPGDRLHRAARTRSARSLA